MNTGASTLRDYLSVLRRRKWIALLPIIMVPVIAVAYSKLQTPRYSASAEVLVGQSLANSLSGVPTSSLSSDPQRIIDTQASIAQSPQVAAAVVRHSRLKLTPGTFLGSSSVSAKAGQDVLVFQVGDRYPTIAVRLANLYAAEYIGYANLLATRALRKARDDLQAKIASLQASGDTKSAYYNDLVSKDQQLSTMEALQTGNATLLQRASSASKVQPTPTRNGLFGLLVGVVLGLGLAFFRDHLDTRVRHASEVSDRLGLPLLGRLPEPPRNLRRDNRLVMLEQPTSRDAEPYRVLVTNIEFVSHELKPRTIMVTSAREGEGKSTTAANLAIAVARTGKRVALVDLDLRRPFLHEFFHIPPEPGLTTMSVGRATLADSLVPVPVDGKPAYLEDGETSHKPRLDVLCSGAIPPNPGEFIRSRGVGRLISHLSETYDSVIIDAAPLLGLGDSLVLIPRVDAVLLVARLELLRRPTLAELSRVLDGTSANALGIVVTASEREGDAYGYGYGYSRYAYGSSDSRNGRPLPMADAAGHEEHV